MQPLLLDEGVPARRQISAALRGLGLDVHAVGDPAAPPIGSTDATNCQWCADRDAVLVTNDRGRKDKAVIVALRSSRVHTLFIYRDLREAKAHELVRALLNAEGKIDHIAGGSGLLHHRLRRGGGLEKR